MCQSQDSLSIYDVALVGLNSEESGYTPDLGRKEELANSVRQILVDKATMLDEYFSMVVDAEGKLCSLPLLLGKRFVNTAAC